MGEKILGRKRGKIAGGKKALGGKGGKGSQQGEGGKHRREEKGKTQRKKGPYGGKGEWISTGKGGKRS